MLWEFDDHSCLLLESWFEHWGFGDHSCLLLESWFELCNTLSITHLLYASQQSRYCKCSSNHSVFQMFNLGILSLNILKGSELYASQHSRYCNCSSNHSCGNSASRGKQLQVLAGDGSPSKSSIEGKQWLLKVLPATTNSIKIKHRRQTIKWPSALEHHK